MPNAQIVSVGGAGIDILVRTASLPSAGQCVTATSFHEGVGGKGANQSVAAARLGATSALVAAIGNDDRGARVVARLEREGVACHHVARIAGASTAAVVIESDATGRKQVAVLRGANALLSVEHIEAAADLIRNASVLLVQFEIPSETAERAVEIASAAGARVILDASPAGRADARLLPLVYGVKANAHEAAALTGVTVRDVDSARAAARKLTSRGIRLVVIEAGNEGNLFVLDGSEVIQPLFDVPSIDPTGAGDAMTGALAVAIVERLSLNDLARFAGVAAALATRCQGAQPGMPNRVEIDAFRVPQA